MARGCSAGGCGVCGGGGEQHHALFHAHGVAHSMQVHAAGLPAPADCVPPLTARTARTATSNAPAPTTTLGCLLLGVRCRRPDHERLRPVSEAPPAPTYPKPDGKVTFDLPTSLYRSGARMVRGNPYRCSTAAVPPCVQQRRGPGRTWPSALVRSLLPPTPPHPLRRAPPPPPPPSTHAHARPTAPASTKRGALASARARASPALPSCTQQAPRKH